MLLTNEGFSFKRNCAAALLGKGNTKNLGSNKFPPKKDFEAGVSAHRSGEGLTPKASASSFFGGYLAPINLFETKFSYSTSASPRPLNKSTLPLH